MSLAQQRNQHQISRNLPRGEKNMYLRRLESMGEARSRLIQELKDLQEKSRFVSPVANSNNSINSNSNASTTTTTTSQQKMLAPKQRQQRLLHQLPAKYPIQLLQIRPLLETRLKELEPKKRRKRIGARQYCAAVFSAKKESCFHRPVLFTRRAQGCCR